MGVKFVPDLYVEEFEYQISYFSSKTYTLTNYWTNLIPQVSISRGNSEYHSKFKYIVIINVTSSLYIVYATTRCPIDRSTTNKREVKV